MMPPGEELARALVAAARARLAESTAKIKHCLGQLSDAQLWWRPRESQNSIANLVLHLCGNVQQWIVSGCGDAPDTRDRPREFAEREMLPAAELVRRLGEVIRAADGVLDGLTAEQLLARRRIQGFDTTVLAALFDSVPHFSGHTQEIVCLTRLQLGGAYRFWWVPATAEQGAPG
jgi:hypothetical protein